MVRSSVTSKISVVGNTALGKKVFHWFESNISLFTLTSAFPSLSIHFDIFFSSSGSNITAFFCITL